MTNPTAQLAQCPSCRALVASDQGYCLTCGARQAGARTPFESPAATNGGPAGDQVTAPEAATRDWTPVVALGGLAVLAVVLLIGVLIGRSGQSSPLNVAASAPQVITVQGGGGGPAAAPASTAATASTGSKSISDEWPSGKSAWTVELQTLAKAGATTASVDSAKAAAKGKGASAVGVLDGSNYKSLGSGYIIYSGVYGTQAKANATLGKLKKSFPSAKVIHVVTSGGGSGGSAGAPVSAAQQQQGAAAIQQLNSCQGSACSKKKITTPIATPGKPPPKDNKPAGGGSGGGQTFQ